MTAEIFVSYIKKEYIGTNLNIMHVAETARLVFFRVRFDLSFFVPSSDY